MNFSEIQDKVVKAYDFPLQASDEELKKFFHKIGEVDQIRRVNNTVYILFRENVDQDSVEVLDGNDFLGGQISLKTGSSFSDDEKREVQDNTQNDFEFIQNESQKNQQDQSHKKNEELDTQNTLDEIVKLEEETRKIHQKQREFQELQEQQKRQDKEKSEREERERIEKEQQQKQEELLKEKQREIERQRQKEQEERDRAQEIERRRELERQKDLEKHFKPEQQQDADVKQIYKLDIEKNNCLKLNSLGSGSNNYYCIFKVHRPKGGNRVETQILAKAEFWAIIGGAFIVNQLFSVLVGY